MINYFKLISEFPLLPLSSQRERSTDCEATTRAVPRRPEIHDHDIVTANHLPEVFLHGVNRSHVVPVFVGNFGKPLDRGPNGDFRGRPVPEANAPSALGVLRRNERRYIERSYRRLRMAATARGASAFGGGGPATQRTWSLVADWRLPSKPFRLGTESRLSPREPAATQARYLRPRISRSTWSRLVWRTSLPFT